MVTADLMFFAVVALALVIVFMLNKAPQDKVEGALDSAKTLAALLRNLADDKNQNTTTTFERLSAYAETAVDAAEQLYKSGQLPKDKRYDYAEQLVRKLFKTDHPDGIFDDWYSVVESIIEAAVKRTKGPVLIEGVHLQGE